MSLKCDYKNKYVNTETEQTFSTSICLYGTHIISVGRQTCKKKNQFILNPNMEFYAYSLRIGHVDSTIRKRKRKQKHTPPLWLSRNKYFYLVYLNLINVFHGDVTHLAAVTTAHAT